MTELHESRTRMQYGYRVIMGRIEPGFCKRAKLSCSWVTIGHRLTIVLLLKWKGHPEFNDAWPSCASGLVAVYPNSQPKPVGPSTYLRPVLPLQHGYALGLVLLKVRNFLILRIAVIGTELEVSSLSVERGKVQATIVGTAKLADTGNLL
jgi:hypothetical protein